MRFHPWLLGALLFPGILAAQDASVQVQPPALNGSRPIEKQTEAAVLRDYTAAWQSLGSALAHNDPALLGTDFVGTAQTKLADTIAAQVAAGVHAGYLQPTHSIQFVFYSSEGSSIELIDTVSYTQELYDKSGLLARQPVTARYIVVMTPAEVRWKVRVFQASAQ